METRNGECTVHYKATGSIIAVIGVIDVVTNIMVSKRVPSAQLKKTTELCIKLMAGVSIFLATLMTISSCLASFTCYLDNLTICVLQGAVLRLTRTTASLVPIMYYTNMLSLSIEHHPRRQMLKISFLLLITGWLITAVMLELPLFASTSYDNYPGLFACDLEDERVLVTSDCVIFCMPALAVLVVSVGLLVLEFNHRIGHRISYVVSQVQGSAYSNADNRTIKRVGKAGLFISAVMFLEWVVRVSAVLGSQHLSSRSLFSMSAILMVLMSLSVPACLLLLAESQPASTDSEHSQVEDLATAQKETRFHRRGSPTLPDAVTAKCVDIQTKMEYVSNSPAQTETNVTGPFDVKQPAPLNLEYTLDSPTVQTLPAITVTAEYHSLSSPVRTLKYAAMDSDGNSSANAGQTLPITATPSGIDAMYEEYTHSTSAPKAQQHPVQRESLDLQIHGVNYQRDSVSCDRSIGSWIVNRQRY